MSGLSTAIPFNLRGSRTPLMQILSVLGTSGQHFEGSQHNHCIVCDCYIYTATYIKFYFSFSKGHPEHILERLTQKIR